MRLTDIKRTKTDTIKRTKTDSWGVSPVDDAREVFYFHAKSKADEAEARSMIKALGGKTAIKVSPRAMEKHLTEVTANWADDDVGIAPFVDGKSLN